MRRSLLSVMTTTALARPIVIGLTGSIGMGKSTASTYLRSAGVRVHDADACVHSLYSPGGAAVEPVCAAFPGVRGAAGGIDRSLLSAAVAKVGKDEALKTLERIVHPLVAADRDGFIEQAANDGEWLVVLDVPLLLETMSAADRGQLCDALVVVSAPADVQRERVLARPGMSADKFEFILSKQVPDAEKRAAADFIIDTSSPSLAPARAQLAACLQALAHQHAAAYERWRDGYTPITDGRRAAKTAQQMQAVTFDLDETLVRAACRRRPAASHCPSSNRSAAIGSPAHASSGCTELPH